MIDLTEEVTALLLDEPLTPTDTDVDALRPCPDCRYDIHPGYQHGRRPQPGSSHVVCSLQRAMRWEHYDPPWPVPPHEQGDSFVCSRCDGVVPPYWRHFIPTCRGCAVWSVVGQSLMACFGLNGHEWLYWGVRPWCRDCHGVGFLACQPQDLSIMRRSGSCATCGAWSFVLFHATKDEHGDIEGSARHYDGEADHEVVVGAAPLTRTLTETFDRASR